MERDNRPAGASWPGLQADSGRPPTSAHGSAHRWRRIHRPPLSFSQRRGRSSRTTSAPVDAVEPARHSLQQGRSRPHGRLVRPRHLDERRERAEPASMTSFGSCRAGNIASTASRATRGTLGAARVPQDRTRQAPPSQTARRPGLGDPVPRCGRARSVPRAIRRGSSDSRPAANCRASCRRPPRPCKVYIGKLY